MNPELTAWYTLKNPHNVPSPALLVYPHRVEQNIRHLIDIAGGASRLRPHVKTHKLPQIIAMHQAHGINKIKCSTIAEAEMAAACEIKDILLAYQPVGPNQNRLLNLAEAYPDTQFGCLVDNATTVEKLAAALRGTSLTLNVWIDIDNGMGRTGIQPGEAAAKLAHLIDGATDLNFAGLHVYDGQFSRWPIAERTARANEAFKTVFKLIEQLEQDGLEVTNIVAGGSPTFPVHALNQSVDLSPGTYVFWDAGYARRCPELPFQQAALILTRVVSKPTINRLCLDLGHKAIASENPLDRRIVFPAAPEAAFISHSEEHLVIEVPKVERFAVGDVLFGIPQHICPTVALHQEAFVIDEAGRLVDRWPIVARNRRINW
ncbi:MAG: D-TA family PLP-dependent enzyme [Ardenticatenaceae bacterium]|nr:D-TA family PLP-dependent enzyme [Ardenticatenaceae bacterium]